MKFLQVIDGNKHHVCPTADIRNQFTSCLKETIQEKIKNENMSDQMKKDLLKYIDQSTTEG